MKLSMTCLLAVTLGQLPCLRAEEVRVVFVDAPGPEDSSGPCFRLRWESDVLFFNRSQEPLPVVLLGVSNGEPTGIVRSMTLAPHAAVSLAMHETGGLWRPSGSAIGVLHLDVPSAVTTSSRLNLKQVATCVSDIPLNANYGALSLPLFRSLVPANESQVHLVADRGSLPARINVGILNAGSVGASAHVELHEACTDTVLAVRDLAIPADTLVQVEGLRSKDTVTCPHGLLSDPASPKAQSWANYVVVTVSEPSLSYVSSIADDRFPSGTLGVASP